MNGTAILANPTWYAKRASAPPRGALGWCKQPPSGRPLKLIVSDVDSTLIAEEAIDVLAKHADIEAKVSRITDAAMRGELDFSASFRQRIRLLAGISKHALDEVSRNLHIRQGAKELIDWTHGQGAKFGLVSGGLAPIVARLAHQLNADFWLASDVEIKNGRLTGEVQGDIVTAKTKEQTLQKWQSKLYSDTAGWSVAIGDGANDIPMLQAADRGIGIMAKPRVRQYIENFLLLPNLEPLIPLLGGEVTSKNKRGTA